MVQILPPLFFPMVKKVVREKENIKNIPNALTLFRFLATFVMAYLILADFDPKTVVIFYVVAALTDKLDGSWARAFHSVTKFGAKFDIVADRVFFGTTILCLIIYNLFINPGGKIYILALFLIMTREMVTLPAWLMRGFKIPKAKFIGKLTTVFQGIAIALIILRWKGMIYFAIATGVIGIFSGRQYFNDILKKRKVT